MAEEESLMESRTKLFGHPVHPMLVVFPLGLLGGAVIFDVIRIVTGNGYWSEIAFWLIAGGILSGLIAAPFGAIDWLAIPSGTRASRIGFLHGLGNVLVLMIFALSWWMRWDAPGVPGTLALALSFVGLSVALVTGWLGGELVDRLGVGVDDGANVDAPSSLSSRRVIRG
jgi:uncharacterized membrane protein